MVDLITNIRNTARAMIIRQDKILLLRKEGNGPGERFALPGGGQDSGETLRDALDRECKEEIGTSVEIGDLIHVAEFFRLRNTQPPSRRHLVEFLFRCSVSKSYTPRNGPRPDKHQIEVVWVELKELPQLPLFPQYLSTCVPNAKIQQNNLYLGSFHDDSSA